MRRSRLLPLALAISASLFTGLATFAQDPPPDLETGLKPYGSFTGGGIDDISLSQGGLSVHIPLLSYPQRGALHLDFDIFYFGYTTYGYAVHCLKDGTCSDTLIAPTDDIYVDDTQHMALQSGRNCKVPTNPSPPFYYIVPNPTVRTADGANHPIGDTGSGWSFTVDGTGIRTVPSANVNTTPSTITDQAGVTYSSATSSALAKKEDANGNLITLSASGSSTSGWT